MTCALIQGNSIEVVYDIDPPNPLFLPNGDAVHCASVGWTDGTYSIVPAVYAAQPANSQEVGRSYAIEGGQVQITRTWKTVQPSVPEEVSKLWLVRAMRQLNWATSFNAILAQASEDMQEDWQLCSSVKRADPSVNAIAGLMGKSSVDTDALFILAEQLKQAG